MLSGKVKKLAETKKVISILFPSPFCYSSTAPHRFTCRGGISSMRL